MPVVVKVHTTTNLQMKAAGLCATFLLTPGLKGLKMAKTNELKPKPKS